MCENVKMIMMLPELNHSFELTDYPTSDCLEWILIEPTPLCEMGTLKDVVVRNYVEYFDEIVDVL